MNNKYSRLYCENCKLIWGLSGIGNIFNCTQCHKPLVMKSFDPRPKVIGGIAIIVIVIITVFIDSIPIIWIGGVILGASLFFNALKQWIDVKALEPKKMEEVIKEKQILKQDSEHDIITCGKCSKKILILKNQGIIKIKCSNCSSEYRVMT